MPRVTTSDVARLSEDELAAIRSKHPRLPQHIIDADEQRKRKLAETPPLTPTPQERARMAVYLRREAWWGVAARQRLPLRVPRTMSRQRDSHARPRTARGPPEADDEHHLVGGHQGAIEFCRGCYEAVPLVGLSLCEQCSVYAMTLHIARLMTGRATLGGQQLEGRRVA